VLGIVFQTPLVIYYLVRWDIVSAEALQKNRKLAILAAFVIAGAITPTVDPVTQTITAIPLVLLYDIGALAAAPSKVTVLNFVKFAGIVAVIAGLFGGLYYLWPIGHATALRGVVVAGKRPLPTAKPVRLRRGRVYDVREGALARVDFERQTAEPAILIAGPARLQVHAKWEVSLQAGSMLADSSHNAATLQVHSRAADVSLNKGKAEFVSPDANTLTVNVLAGEAVARVEGRSVRILAGRSATFQLGGAPIEAPGIEERWRERMQGDALPVTP